MSRVALPILLLLLLTAQLVRAQEEMTTILVKGYIDEITPIELIISTYDQRQEGTLLYQLTKLVTPKDGIFDDSIEIPSEILNRHLQVFIEFAKVSSPSEPLAAERMQFSHPGVRRDTKGSDITTHDNSAFPSVLVGICFTCDYPFPFEAGAIVTGSFSSGLQNHQYGPGCEGALADGSGTLTHMNDPRPRICVGY